MENNLATIASSTLLGIRISRNDISLFFAMIYLAFGLLLVMSLKIWDAALSVFIPLFPPAIKLSLNFWRLATYFSSENEESCSRALFQIGVAMPAGSINIVPIPKGFNSRRTESHQPSSANFAAR